MSYFRHALPNEPNISDNNANGSTRLEARGLGGFNLLLVTLLVAAIVTVAIVSAVVVDFRTTFN